MPRSFHLLPARPLTALGSATLALSLAGGLALGVVASGPASAAVHSVRSVQPVDKSKKKSTTTTAPKSTTTTTTNASLADTWLIKAIGAENKLGSVKINGTVVQGKTTIKLSLLVNGDGEGGGTFIQDGSKIQLKRVGPLLYFDAPKSFWLHSSTATEAAKYGGKWIEVSALDSRFESFDQFLDAGDLVTAVFQGHTTPLAFGPVLLRNDDGRTSDFPRAMVRYRADDGREGLGWIEWNQPAPA